MMNTDLKAFYTTYNKWRRLMDIQFISTQDKTESEIEALARAIEENNSNK